MAPTGPNPCIVTAPDTSISDKSTLRTAEAALTLLGADILKGGVSASTTERVELIYQKIPDSLVACQMLLQLGACMVSQQQQIGRAYQDLIEKKEVCTTPKDENASSTGSQVFIQIANDSQKDLGKKLQVALGDRGFLAPGVQNMKGSGVPILNEVRYYYPSQFNDAKLVKSILHSHGVSDAMLKPLYSLKEKPSIEKAFIEVWLTNP